MLDIGKNAKIRRGDTGFLKSCDSCGGARKAPARPRDVEFQLDPSITRQRRWSTKRVEPEPGSEGRFELLHACPRIAPDQGYGVGTQLPHTLARRCRHIVVS